MVLSISVDSLECLDPCEGGLRTFKLAFGKDEAAMIAMTPANIVKAIQWDVDIAWFLDEVMPENTEYTEAIWGLIDAVTTDMHASPEMPDALKSVINQATMCRGMDAERGYRKISDLCRDYLPEGIHFHEDRGVGQAVAAILSMFDGDDPNASICAIGGAREFFHQTDDPECLTKTAEYLSDLGRRYSGHINGKMAELNKMMAEESEDGQ